MVEKLEKIPNKKCLIFTKHTGTFNKESSDIP